MRLVLGEDADAAKAGIDQVGQHEINEAIGPAEGDSWLGAVSGQGHESLALASSEDHG